MGVAMSALKDGEEVKEPLFERILGRVTLLEVVDPMTGRLIAEPGRVIDEEVAHDIEQTSIETVLIRSGVDL